MRFGAIHRFLLTLLATFGVLAMMSLGATSLFTDALLAAGLLAVWLVPETFWQARTWLRQAFNAGFLTLFGVELFRWIMGAHPLDLVIEFLALFQVLRLLTRRGAAQDTAILGLAAFQFTAGAIMGGGPAYAACFLGFVIVAPGALVLSHLRREVEGNYRQGARDRTGLPVDVPRILRSRRVVGKGFLAAMGLLSLPILLTMGVLFLLFPRIGLSLLFVGERPGAGIVGFSDHVDLGQVGALRLDPSLSIRFIPANLPPEPPPRLAYRLRGTAYDTYDGRAWSRSREGRRALERAGDTLVLQRFPGPADRRIAFEIEPMDPTIIFLPMGAIAFEPTTAIGETVSVQRGLEGEVRYSTPHGRGLRYDVYLPQQPEIPLEALMPTDRARYLTMPTAPALPSRVRTLAHEWTEGKVAPLERARALEEKLKTFTYDLRAPSGGTPQPVDHFLFETRRGHCEFFSTSLALLLRELGIPSRTVNGFVGGEYNRFGQYYAVRRSNAHAWVEAFIDEPSYPGYGHWMVFDATPASGTTPVESSKSVAYVRDAYEALAERWQRYIVRYNLETQLRAARWVSRRTAFLRSNEKGIHDSSGTVTKALGVACLLLALGWAYFAQRKRSVAPKLPSGALAAPNEAVASLSSALERTLVAIGHPRPAHIPPLRHAEHLAHPAQPELAELTRIYLAARFGGVALDERATSDFMRRVEAVRNPSA